jgi:hypothetical protein
METKDQLINHVKQWIILDEEIRALQKQVKERKIKQKDLSIQLMDVMKSNTIDCFDLSDGKLFYTRSKVKQPINKKLLLTALTKYFNKDEDIEKVTNHIMDSRSEKIKENIKRKIDKEKDNK